MIKTQIKEALNWRYATKLFDPTRKIVKEDIDILKESLRLSPSSFGLQPWKFLFIENKDLREKLKSASWGQKQITSASHLVVLCAKTDIDNNYIKKFIESISKIRNIPLEQLKENEEMIINFRKNAGNSFIENWTKKQVYIALGFLLETAALLQIDACPMEGFEANKFDEILDLKNKGLTSAVVCTLGYRSNNDKYAKLKKARFSPEQLIEEIK